MLKSKVDGTVDVKMIREKASLTQEKLGRVLGTSWVTVSRWERHVARPSESTEVRLKRLKELVARIGKALPKEEVPRFLETPQPLLRGYRPVDLLDNDYSFRDLLSFVDSAKSGDMA